MVVVAMVCYEVLFYRRVVVGCSFVRSCRNRVVLPM